MPDAERHPIGLHLAWLLSVAIAGAFVTTLIITTRDVTTYWPLFIVPVVMASLAYHAPGAVVSVAVCGAAIVLLAYGSGYDVPPVAALVTGAIAFTVSGLVIGVQTQRNRRQRMRLEQDATRDALTGVFCAEYLRNRLTEEVRRGSRLDSRFSLILIGPSGFDDFQRVYGRVKGDLLLERFAEVVTLTVRSIDLVGRLDPSLFAIVMPATNAEQSRGVAERLVAAIDATEFEGDAVEPVVHCTARVVSATFPDDGMDAASLLDRGRERYGVCEPDAVELGNARRFRADASEAPSTEGVAP